MAGGLKTTTKVRGIKETVDALDTLEATFHESSLDSVAEIGNALSRAVGGALPAQAPLSGMARGRWNYGPGSRSAFAVIGGKESGDGWRLISIKATSAGGQVADMAGSRTTGKTPSGRRLIAVLSSRYGRPSRFLWPAARKLMPQVVKALEAAAADASKKVTSDLAKAA